MILNTDSISHFPKQNESVALCFHICFFENILFVFFDRAGTFVKEQGCMAMRPCISKSVNRQGRMAIRPCISKSVFQYSFSFPFSFSFSFCVILHLLLDMKVKQKIMLHRRIDLSGCRCNRHIKWFYSGIIICTNVGI